MVGSSSPCSARARTTTPKRPPGAAAAASASDAELPTTPAGDQLRWALTEGAGADDAELGEHFSADFLAQVPTGELRTVLAGFDAARVSEVRSSEPTKLEAVVVAADGSALTAELSVEAGEPHRINGLLFEAAQLAAPPASWPEVDERLGALASRASIVAAEVGDDGSLAAVHERASDQAGPIGSAFKLYVLGALAEAVSAGTVAWDDGLVIEEADRSLPSGRLQDRVGETVAVAEAAQGMISISDNTATDLLIRTLGPPAVEAVLDPMGLSAQSRARTVPFLTTRQLFTLKWGSPPDLLAEYAAAPEEQRRRLLADLPAELPPTSAVDPRRPVEVDRVEWFASPRELAAAQVYLDQRRNEPGLEPLTEVLGSNPGLPRDPATWPHVAFKGGSEPGVLALSWLLERADGRRFVVALVASDPDKALDEGEGAAIANGAINLLAAAGQPEPPAG
ncbi:MAG: serine hydrolase [Acidimicrobiia bacterium]